MLLQVVEFYYRLIRNADYLVSSSSDGGAATREGSAEDAAHEVPILTSSILYLQHKYM